MWPHALVCAADEPERTVVTPDGLVRSRLRVRSRRNPECSRRRICPRPGQEGRFALPRHESGLDVVALVGVPRHARHRGIPEIHAGSVRRGVPIRMRGVGNLPGRYDESLALSCSDVDRSEALTATAGRVILAIDGLRPDVGHEVPRVIRDAPSGAAPPARSLLSSCQDDLAKPLREPEATPEVPIAGVASDGRASIRKAVAEARKGVPHQPCHCHYLREAAPPVDEADRHAEARSKKEVRGIRPIERQVRGREDAEAEAIRGYCAAARSAPPDDGRPPLEASGLKLQVRLAAVAASPGRVAGSRGSRED